MFRMTEEELARHQARIKGAAPALDKVKKVPDLARPKGRPATAVKQPTKALNQAERFRALGRLPKGRMNETEAEYARHLDDEKAAGRVLDYKFHAIRVRLADNTFYEADFLVLHSDMTLAIHETKGGFTTDKGQLKIKLVAEVLPYFRMIKATKLAKKNGGGWKLEEF